MKQIRPTGLSEKKLVSRNNTSVMATKHVLTSSHDKISGIA